MKFNEPYLMQFRYWKACDLSSDEKLERGIRLSADNVKTPDYTWAVGSY
jgi:hypothetical protein